MNNLQATCFCVNVTGHKSLLAVSFLLLKDLMEYLPEHKVRSQTLFISITVEKGIHCIHWYPSHTSLYPSLLKKADITSVHKKDSKSAKNNYRSASILSKISKLYEQIMIKRM